MPKRNIVLANQQIYHIFNKAIDARPIFKHKRELKRAILALWYYHYKKRLYSLSAYLRLEKILQANSLNQLISSENSIEILCYCLMRNHYHLLIKQKRDNGISKYLSDFQNSFTRYYNAVHERRGPIFLNQFRAVRIETDEQLIHVSRYIHLNPYSSFLVKTLDQLIKYPWSSLPTYLGRAPVKNKKHSFINIL